MINHPPVNLQKAYERAWCDVHLALGEPILELQSAAELEMYLSLAAERDLCAQMDEHEAARLGAEDVIDVIRLLNLQMSFAA